MRGAQFDEYGPPAVVRIVEVDEPRAGPGTVRVAVRASGVSTGEVRVRSGGVRDRIAAPLPWHTGFDAAGVVDEVGPGVAGTAVGDEVFGMVDPALRGANADLAVLTAWAPRPAEWTWEEAGAAGGGVETAVRVLEHLALPAGATLLVQGAAGATAAVVVQFAVARGIAVVGTASPANHDFLRTLGVEPTTYGPGLAERVRALVPSGVDAVLDAAGGSLPALVAIAGDEDRVVTIADLDAAAHGVVLSHSAPVAVAGAAGTTGSLLPHARQALDEAGDLAAARRLRIPVAAALPLAEVAAAHALGEARHAPGRIVLVP